MTGDATLPSLPGGGVAWVEVPNLLVGLDGFDLNDVAEHIIEAAAEEGAPAAAAALMVVLTMTGEDGTRSRAAEGLAALADPNNDRAVDALSDGFRAYRRDAFLGSAYLRALGIFALRSALAQADLTALLLRLRDEDDAFVLVAAAKAAGHLSALGRDEPGALLLRLTQHDDPSVRGEATYQWAYSTLGAALRADNQGGLLLGITAARDMFRTAVAIEENRSDADAMSWVLDALLAFLELPGGSPSALVGVEQAAERLEALLGTSLRVDPTGIASASEQYALITMAEVMGQLRAAARTVSVDEHWSSPSSIVVSLAQAYAELRGDPSDLMTDARLSAFRHGVTEKVFAATLGTLLRRELNARQLERARLEYQRTSGDDLTTASLRTLEGIVREAEVPAPISPQFAQIRALASQHGWSTDDVLEDLAVSLADLDPTRLIQRIGLQGTLPVSQALLSTLTPDNELVVRKVVLELQGIIGAYPSAHWEHLTRVLGALVEQTRYLRKYLPEFLRVEPQGKGQTAREGDLQDDLRRALHARFSDQLSDEHRGIAGGRVDLMVTFADARFPIEVKHEFRDVSRVHIQQNYLVQADLYAGESNRITFLMILDLRDHSKPDSVTGQPISLYSLEESFWVQSLDPDPQIVNAKRNGVVIGLVPGNRQHPSDTTNYSNAPRNKQKKRASP